MPVRLSFLTNVVFGLLTIIVLLRFVASVCMILVPEEAYYWMYAQHPSLSYYDHPPMIAWVIGLGTQFFGNNEFGVRSATQLLMLASSALMYVYSRIWFSREAALGAALLPQILPVYFGSGLIATMDGSLIFFWTLALWAFSLALKEQRAWGWYLGGIATGGAMLCKYTGLFLGLGVILAVLAYRPWRRELLRPHPYIAAVLALALFTPVLIWNAEHDWASFRFQFVERYHGNGVGAAHVALFAGFQLLVLTPVVFAGFAWLLFRTIGSTRRVFQARWLIALCFCLPMLAVIAYKSLRYDIHLNWTLPLYLSVFPAIMQLGIAGWRRSRARRAVLRWCRAASITVVFCLLLDLAAMLYLLFAEPKLGRVAALGPWPRLAREVQEIADRQQAQKACEYLIVGFDKNRLASVLAFYRTPLEKDVRASDFTTSQWIIAGDGLAYPYWTEWEEEAVCDAIVVDDHKTDGLYLTQKSKLKPLEELHIRGKTYSISLYPLGRR